MESPLAFDTAGEVGLSVVPALYFWCGSRPKH
jgi:hypothetical protein